MIFENKGKWFMESNKNLNWLKESDDTDLLEDDELDIIDEGLYVDPGNYGNYDDLVDVVDSNGNPQKMTQRIYDANKDSGEFKKKEPEKPSTADRAQSSSSTSELVDKYQKLYDAEDDEDLKAAYKAKLDKLKKPASNQELLDKYQKLYDAEDDEDLKAAYKTKLDKLKQNDKPKEEPKEEPKEQSKTAKIVSSRIANVAERFSNAGSVKQFENYPDSAVDFAAGFLKRVAGTPAETLQKELENQLKDAYGDKTKDFVNALMEKYKAKKYDKKKPALSEVIYAVPDAPISMSMALDKPNERQLNKLSDREKEERAKAALGTLDKAERALQDSIKADKLTDDEIKQLKDTYAANRKFYEDIVNKTSGSAEQERASAEQEKQKELDTYKGNDQQKNALYDLLHPKNDYEDYKKLQTKINKAVKAERESGKPGSEADTVNSLRKRQYDIAKKVQQALKGASKEEQKQFFDQYFDASGLSPRHRDNFEYQVKAVSND